MKTTTTQSMINVRIMRHEFRVIMVIMTEMLRCCSSSTLGSRWVVTLKSKRTPGFWLHHLPCTLAAPVIISELYHCFGKITKMQLQKHKPRVSCFTYRQISNIRNTPNPKTQMFLVSSCSCLCPFHWSQVLSREWILWPWKWATLS